MYVERLKAIKFFADEPGFDLYGCGWNKPVRYTHAYDKSIKNTYRGEVEDKLSKLSEYKFCLVIENCIFDGCVTEKIIDAVAAGWIPVYWRAPDITDYVPEKCFVDFRKFKDFKELNNFLKNMDESMFNQYIENIKNFFASDTYYKHFSKEKFAKDLVNVFELHCK